MVSRHIVVVLRHHEITSDRALQVIFFSKFLYRESSSLTSVPIVERNKTRFSKYFVTYNKSVRTRAFTLTKYSIFFHRR